MSQEARTIVAEIRRLGAQEGYFVPEELVRYVSGKALIIARELEQALDRADRADQTILSALYWLQEYKNDGANATHARRMLDNYKILVMDVAQRIKRDTPMGLGDPPTDDDAKPKE